MSDKNEEKQWLDWLWEGRGELFGCFPPEFYAGEGVSGGEKPAVESAPE